MKLLCVQLFELLGRLESEENYTLNPEYRELVKRFRTTVEKVRDIPGAYSTPLNPGSTAQD